MKKILKNRIFVVIITMIICISGTLYATTKYNANEISYNEITVEDALNDLYKSANNNNIPIIKNIDYSYYTHIDWKGMCKRAIILTIEPNGANSITLNLENEAPTGNATASSDEITEVTNGTFSDMTIVPENKNSDVVVTFTGVCGTLISSGSSFNSHLKIESYT